MKKHGIYRARLSKKLSEKAAAFVSSTLEDERILEEDITGTEAHDLMLYKQGILSRSELNKILTALEKIRAEWKSRKIQIDPSVEDIHEFLESKVIGKIGIDVGGKIHTGRSRNDQVAVDIRMGTRKELNELSASLLELGRNLIKKAEKSLNIPMVLYTHTQHAQIGTFGHYLLAQASILMKDFDRIENCYRNVNLSPLGACAIGGSSFELDRKMTASLLGFDGLIENSVEAVSSRDFALEAACASSILMSNLSRIAEDLILWSSEEFGYIELSDEHASTSSVMPQKKNPCVIELMRGRTGEVYGALVGLLSIVKGLITGYNRDLQQVKPLLWRCFDHVKSSVEVLAEVISKLQIKEARMREATSRSYAVALDLAEALCREYNVPFRKAHAIVGETVREAIGSGLKLSELSPETLSSAAEKILGRRISVREDFIKKFTDPLSSLTERQTLGCPSPTESSRMLEEAKKLLEERQLKLAKRLEKLENAERELGERVKRVIRKKG